MSGTVAVTEAPDGGARFTVTFPVADPERAQDTQAQDTQAQDREEAGHGASA